MITKTSTRVNINSERKRDICLTSKRKNKWSAWRCSVFWKNAIELKRFFSLSFVVVAFKLIENDDAPSKCNVQHASQWQRSSKISFCHNSHCCDAEQMFTVFLYRDWMIWSTVPFHTILNNVVSLWNWFQFNKLGKRLWKLMISCRKLASIQLHVVFISPGYECHCYRFRSHFFSLLRWKSLKEICLIQLLLILNLWLGTAFFLRMHFSHFSNFSKRESFPKLQFLLVLLLHLHCWGEIQLLRRIKIDLNFLRIFDL